MTLNQFERLDFHKLKVGGRDKYSAMKLPELQAEIANSEGQTADVLRWACRVRDHVKGAAAADSIKWGQAIIRSKEDEQIRFGVAPNDRIQRCLQTIVNACGCIPCLEVVEVELCRMGGTVLATRFTPAILKEIMRLRLNEANVNSDRMP